MRSKSIRPVFITAVSKSVSQEKSFVLARRGYAMLAFRRICRPISRGRPSLFVSVSEISVLLYKRFEITPAWNSSCPSLSMVLPKKTERRMEERASKWAATCSVTADPAPHDHFRHLMAIHSFPKIPNACKKRRFNRPPPNSSRRHFLFLLICSIIEFTKDPNATPVSEGCCFPVSRQNISNCVIAINPES